MCGVRRRLRSGKEVTLWGCADYVMGVASCFVQWRCCEKSAKDCACTRK
jgi:hypothetical protein